MPLIKSSSKQALRTNVEQEIHAKIAQGYSPKKAAAIAYAIGKDIQRRHAPRKGA